MDCAEYRRLHAEYGTRSLPQEVYESAGFSAWIEHSYHCRECSDWTLGEQVHRRGADPERFPCVHIADKVTQHPGPWEDPDVLITYDERFDEYALVGRAGSYSIEYCPWCGVRLPESKRERWFDELRALGVADPWLDDDIPEHYKTGAWYRNGLTGPSEEQPSA